MADRTYANLLAVLSLSQHRTHMRTQAATGNKFSANAKDPSKKMMDTSITAGPTVPPPTQNTSKSCSNKQADMSTPPPSPICRRQQLHSPQARGTQV
jgi:hypothetical protein